MMGLVRNAVSKIETLRWFASRPTMHRELVRRLVSLRISTRRTRAEDARARDEAQRWCEAHARAPEDVLRALGLETSIHRVTELFPERWSEAAARVVAVPGVMGGPADVDLLYHVAKHLPATRVVETGVAAGWSSLAILSAIDGRPGARLSSVDMPYPKRRNEEWVGCAVPAQLRSCWTLVRLPDRDALATLTASPGSIDLAHYDSDKSYAGRRFGYDRLWAALRPGGVLMSDDIEDNLAFVDFARAVDREPLVVRKVKPGNFAGLIRR